MTDIVTQAQHVADLISEIGVTTQEQESGISQINQAITQLDSVTQQNAALVEESTSAAESLSEQAAKLVELMSVFNIAHASVAPSPSASPRRQPQTAPALKKPAALKPALKPALASRNNNHDWEQF